MSDEKIGRKYVKRKFSFEDRQKYYNLWKNSGLNKSKFCKEHNLSVTAFSNWCNKQNSWLPVSTSSNSAEELSSQAKIELNIPPGIKKFLYSSSIILILLELFHAIAVIYGKKLWILKSPVDFGSLSMAWLIFLQIISSKIHKKVSTYFITKPGTKLNACHGIRMASFSSIKD